VSQRQKYEPQQRVRRQIRQQRQQWLAIGAVVAVALVIFSALLILLTSARSTFTVGKYDLLHQTTTTTGIPILGDAQTSLTITEITDFGCPPCVAYQATIQQFINEFVRTGQARFELVIIVNHPHSEVASQAALCAGQHHKFWEMSDALYDVENKQGTDGFTVDNLRHVAESLGIDGSALLDCVIGGQTLNQLNAALSFYESVHAAGTPVLLWSADGVANWKPFIGNDNQPYLHGGVPMSVIDRTISDFYRTLSS